MGVPMRIYVLLLMGLVFLAGCGERDTPDQPQEPAAIAEPAKPEPAVDVTAEETARLNEWLDAKFEEELDFSPMRRSFLGDKKDYAKIDDLSEQAQDFRLEWRRLSVEELKSKFDRARLTPQGQVSYDLWLYEYDQAAAADQFRRNDYTFNPFYALHTALAQFLVSVHKVDEPEDMDAYIDRINEGSRALMQQLDSAKLNAAAGVRPPRFAYDGVIAQSQALIRGAPFEGEGNSDIWADAQAKVDALVAADKIDQATADQYKSRAREALLQSWQPAYRTLIAWLEEDRPNSDENAKGVGQLPNGEAYYAERLANSTTTDMTPEAVHQIGLQNIERIKGEMEAIKESVGFKGTLQEFFKFVREDERFYYPNTDEGRQAYIDAATAHLAFMKTRLPDYFGILPKADVIVKRVEPYREKPGAPQHYFRASLDGSRPGVFYAHLSDMSAMPIPQLEVIAYHEGNPGHHMQFSIMQELTDLPKFRTLLSYNVFQEGWGLYTEWLTKEMGGYQDPYSDFGRLSTEIWRAIRLVLDTGIHSKGWTEEQSVQFFMENSSSAEGQIRAEVQRYILWPGQATGYMVGMLKMRELRARAESELGDRFDIKGFHDTILTGGQMPLRMLDQRINTWIEGQKAG